MMSCFIHSQNRSVLLVSLSTTSTSGHRGTCLLARCSCAKTATRGARWFTFALFPSPASRVPSNTKHATEVELTFYFQSDRERCVGRTYVSVVPARRCSLFILLKFLMRWCVYLFRPARCVAFVKSSSFILCVALFLTLLIEGFNTFINKFRAGRKKSICRKK